MRETIKMNDPDEGTRRARREADKYMKELEARARRPGAPDRHDTDKLMRELITTDPKLRARLRRERTGRRDRPKAESLSDWLARRLPRGWWW